MITASVAAGFQWMLEQRNEGMTHWLGSQWSLRDGLNVHRFLRSEISELQDELQPMKLNGPDTLTPSRRLRSRLELVDCVMNVMTLNLLTWVGPHAYAMTPKDYEPIVNLWMTHGRVYEAPQTRSALLTAVDEFTFNMVCSTAPNFLDVTEHNVKSTCKLLTAFGMDFQELLTLMIAKQTLNTFRVNRGYTRPGGSYNKTWMYNGVPTPDTLVAAALVEPMGDSTTRCDRLYNQLIDIYEEAA